MKIFKSLGYLSDDMARQILAKVGKSDNLMEKLAAWRKLEDDVIEFLRLGKLDEFDDVGMVQLPHDLDLFQDVGALCKRQCKYSRSSTLLLV